MARFGIPSQGRDALAYVDSRLTGVPTVDSKRDPTVNDTNYPIQTIWRNSTLLKECMLVGFVGGEAQWKCFTDSDGTMLQLTADDSNEVQPLAGNINVLGDTQLAGVLSQPVFTDGATANTLKVQVQLGSAVSPTPADFNSAGLLSANNNQFVVDATSGMFSLKGGGVNPAIQQVDVDFNTAPGTDPVVADGSGQISVFGNTVTNATNANSPVATHSRAASQYHVDVQLGAAVAPTPADPYDVGLLSVDSTQMTVDGNGFMQIKDAIVTQSWANLGITYDSGLFSVTAEDGTALSATNKGRARVQVSGTPGENHIIELVKPYTFFDDAHATTHDLEGWYPSTTSGSAWDEDRPFFIYVIQHDTATSDPAIGISLVPNFKKAPAVGKLNIAGTIADASAVDSMFLLRIDGSTPTIGNYDGNSCVCVGSFRMQLTDTGNDDWTVQALENTDGVGAFQENQNFLVPDGVSGAATGTFFHNQGGATVRTFGPVQQLSYTINRDGLIELRYNCDSCNNTPSGSNDLQMILPYATSAATQIEFLGAYLDGSTSPQTRKTIIWGIKNNKPYTAGTVGGGVGPYESGTNTKYTIGTVANGDSIQGVLTYLIYGET